jgi:drug/metabolite transporter (DMT)-like permease
MPLSKMALAGSSALPVIKSNPRVSNEQLSLRDWWPLLLAVLCNGARYHVDALALRTASPLAVLTVGAFSAAGCFMCSGWWWRWQGWSAASLQHVHFVALGVAWRRVGRILLCSATVGAGGAWLTAIANQLYGPATTAFLANSTLVFMVLAGILVGEKIRLPEIVAILVIVVGAFLFSYRGASPQWSALGLMGAACLLTASKQLFTKRATGLTHLPSAMTLALIFMGLWGLGTGIVTGQLDFGSGGVFLLMMAGGVLGSMLGMSLLYVGFHRVGVARGSAVDAMRPLAVLLFGLLFGTALPSSLQLSGAVLVLGGSAFLPFLARRRPLPEENTP